MVTKTTTKKPAATTATRKRIKKEAEGVKNVSTPWNVSVKSVTAETVPKFQNSILYQQAFNPLKMQVFPEPPTITVKNPDDETDDELSAQIREEFIRLDCYDRMQYVLSDVCGYGAAVYSIGAGFEDGKFVMKEIRHLDARSFNQTPMNAAMDDCVIVNELMPGIIVNKGEVEVWQTYHGKQSLIENPIIVRGTCTPEPSGLAMLKPIYEYISYINFATEAQLQQISRVGAPIFLPKIADDVTESDIPYLMQWSEKAVKTWDKDSAMVVPQGIEFPTVSVNENTVAKETIEMWRQWINDFANPMAMMQQTGNLGASDTGRMEMWANYISSLQDMCEHWLEKVFDMYLEANGYEGYHVKIELKRPTVDRSDKVIQVLQSSGTDMTTIERRDAIASFTPVQLQDTTDEVLAELKEQQQSKQSTLGLFTNTADGFKGKEEKQVKSMQETLRDINAATEAKILEILNYGQR